MAKAAKSGRRATAVVRQFESIRKTGVAFDREEYVRGVRCVVAPVVDRFNLPQDGDAKAASRSARKATP